MKKSINKPNFINMKLFKIKISHEVKLVLNEGLVRPSSRDYMT